MYCQWVTQAGHAFLLSFHTREGGYFQYEMNFNYGIMVSNQNQIFVKMVFPNICSMLLLFVCLCFGVYFASNFTLMIQASYL